MEHTSERFYYRWSGFFRQLVKWLVTYFLGGCGNRGIQSLPVPCLDLTPGCFLSYRKWSTRIRITDFSVDPKIRLRN